MTMVVGTVLAQEANFYRVRPDDSQEILLCTRRARLKKTGQAALVGDRVEVERDSQSERGVISALLPRRSVLEKPPIANATGVLVVFALTDPPFDPALLSRFLVQVESAGLEVFVCLSKRDEAPGEEVSNLAALVRSWGYRVYPLSARTGDGVETLLEQISGTLVLAGPSGAGKSSLLNALVPGLELRVGEVSNRDGRGRHTTRHVELFALGAEALVADSPGFNQLELTVEPELLAQYFPEFRPYLGRCQFRNCLHQDEPGCAIRSQDFYRYGIYREFLAEARELARAQRRTANPDVAIRSRDGRGTQVPRLASTLRTTSRRTSRQQLRQWEAPAESEDEENL